AASRTPALIGRDEIWRGKRAALEIIYRQPLSPERAGAFERFRAGQGGPLEDWAAWCALAGVHGADWRAWPPPLRRPDSPAVRAERARLAPAIRFHAWLQWLAGEQRSAAQAAARSAGMEIGIIGDLAVGTRPAGADAWSSAR